VNQQDRDALEHELKNELWRRGEIRWKLRPVQEKIYNHLRESDSLKEVINASRRIGKTHTLCTIAIEAAMKKPGAQIHFGFPSQRALKKVIQPIFRYIIRDCPADYKPQYQASDFAYYFPRTDSLVHLSGLNAGHAENLRGNASDLAIVDEAGYVDDLDYVVQDILLPQCLTTEGRIIISSTPPPTPVHEFVDFAHKAKEEGTYSEFTIFDSGYPDHIIQKFMKESGGAESSTWKREYLCQFVVDQDLAIIPEFDEKKHTLPWERTALWPYYKCYVSMDIGVRDFTVVLFGYYDFMKAALFIEDELVMKGPTMTSDLLQRAIKAKEAIWFKDKTPDQILRVSDDNNLILIQDMGYLHQIPFNPTTKDNLDAMVNELRVWVGNGRVNLNPRCAHTIGCLKYGVWDINKQRKREFARSKVYGHFDGLAALVYLVRNIDQYTNPIPADLHMSELTHHISAEFDKKREPSRVEIEKIIGVRRRNRGWINR